MKLNLRAKLIGNLSVVLLLMVIVGLIGVYTSKYIQTHLEDTIEQDVKPAGILSIMSRRVGFIHSNSLLHMFTRSTEDMNRYESEIADWSGKINTDIDILENTFKDQSTLYKLAEFNVAWEKYLKVWNEQVVPLSRANRDEETFALTRKEGHYGTTAQEAMYKFDELHDAIIAIGNNSLELTKQKFRRNQYILLSVIFIAIILGLTFGVKQSLFIANAVNTVSKAAQLVTAGDLNQRVVVSTGDEIEDMADSFNTMVKELQYEISKRKRTEKKLKKYQNHLEELIEERTLLLKESEDRMRILLENLPVGVSLSTPKGEVPEINTALWKTFGYDSKEEFANVPAETHYYNSKDRERFVKLHKKGLVKDFDVRLKRKDGTVFWGSVTSITTFIKADKVFINVFNDITNRKQTEKELQKYRQQLEALVEVRTTELKTANKELEAFSYSVSHDLRAPLRAIDGFTRILIEDYASKLDKEGKRLGSVIQDNAKKMGNLIDDLLAFSRLGRASMTSTKIDMKNMVNAIYHEATSVEERKRIKFTIADIPEAQGDTNLMRQVWMNLIINAVKFSSDRKQAVISVSCQEEDSKLIYCIKDNGAGFNMKYVDKIFGVFHRLHSEKEFKGTGVGLALVQRIIRRHSGNVWAEGNVDKGATFYFSLPKK